MYPKSLKRNLLGAGKRPSEGIVVENWSLVPLPGRPAKGFSVDLNEAVFV